MFKRNRECLKCDVCQEMNCVKYKIRIVVVDDMPRVVEGILDLLRAWPGKLEIHTIMGIPRGTTEDLANEISGKNPHIVLLDESIGSLKGSDVANILLEKRFNGILVSITGGQCPNFTPFCFLSKMKVALNQKAASNFIGLMNQIFKFAK